MGHIPQNNVVGLGWFYGKSVFFLVLVDWYLEHDNKIPFEGSDDEILTGDDLRPDTRLVPTEWMTEYQYGPP